ncbi:hypothetical protein BGW38_000067 [Lunasporangiospora selenospora]|uniref:Uncharacterized protein n=1 Tax=Lunasporangiospora selenospora TaxID=979761 RepID=A0A9P6KI71_9FUNG|nr:hypothetical protein BGW38_000067 [Lunasporangiospora selenospora]
MTDFYPSCIHSTFNHNTVSLSGQSNSTDSSSCSCEDCSRYRAPLQSLSTIQEPTLGGGSSGADHVGANVSTSSSAPQRTFLTRRTSSSTGSGFGFGGTMNSSTAPSISPKGAPAGFGAGIRPHQRRASVEYSNSERIFVQHSTACDCRGSGVGCGCSYDCSC